ncbi:hypothetical protein C8J56DRAFT_542671 [Mycena floridula]|nr:hypothetical protein C8J56DRAFT_542671 [Mycena floridula]
MAFMPIYRLASLGTALLFSVIVLGISAHIVWFTTTGLGFYYTFSAMCLAVAIMTIITFPIMIIIDFKRKGAFTSMIIVELVWTALLSILWLAAAGLAANANELTFISGCGYGIPGVDQACQEFAAVEAFSFLTWLIVMGYAVVLFIFSIIAASRGHHVWTSTVGETDFRAPRANAQYGEKPQQGVPQNQAQYPPQQMTPQPQGYPPQGTPPQGYPHHGSPQPQGYPQV